MLYPEINQLRDAAGSRYYLVSMTAKRARDLIASWDPEKGYRKLDRTIETDKPVSIAAEEIAEGLFTFTPAEDVVEAEEDLEAAEPVEEALSVSEDPEEAVEEASEEVPEAEEE